MKFLFLLIINVLLITAIAVAQSNQPLDTISNRAASFIGGQQKMYTIIQSKMKYPSSARKQNIEGRVILKFEIDTTGHIQHVAIVKRVHPLLDSAALRLIPYIDGQWEPGYKNGKKVRTEFNLPVNFKLANEPINTTAKTLGIITGIALGGTLGVLLAKTINVKK